MTSLASKYQPQTIDAFAGLDRPRALFSHLAANPYQSAWLLLGPSGTGKTTMALALANSISGEVHHIPSRKCDLATVEQLVMRCHYRPMIGGFHVIICDECDQMTAAAQLAFLSKLDATAMPPDTIFIFTANGTKKLEDRFLSRCRVVRFEADLDKASAYLSYIWSIETDAPAPIDFRVLLSNCGGNIRAALMELETELIAPGGVSRMVADSNDNRRACGSDQSHRGGGSVDPKRREAALKAWVTMRAKKGIAA